MSRRRFLLRTDAVMAAGPLAVLVSPSPPLAEDSRAQSSHDPQVANISVLAYHQLDNTPDVESLSPDL
ncbi:MAG: hypothetical protein ACRDZ8_20695 [Acidimicrobiales bacterium]